MFKDAVILIINKIIEEKNIKNKKIYIVYIRDNKSIFWN